MAAEQTISKDVQIGVPLPDFEAAVDTLDQLQRAGKFQIFLARENSIRFIGEADEFSVEFCKRLGADLVDKKKSDECLEEVQSFLQVLVATSKPESVARIFEDHVYDDELASVKDDANRLNKLKNILAAKASLVATKLASHALRERARRLATAVGSVLEDIDVEVITKRQSLTQGIAIDAPFLRIRLRYTTAGEPRFAFPIPPWVTGHARDFRSFELECDENDIDLLISRLVRAKDLLSKSIDAKVKREPVESK